MHYYPWTVIQLQKTKSPAETGRESFGFYSRNSPIALLPDSG